ncbi:MAG TPA: ARMT1-like domain-containing protein [bacterium]|nr:ARMT1-like domain-containing protein [bacterium]
MKSGSICYPCFMEQAHSSVMYAVDDEARRWEILREAAPLLADLSMDQSPAYNSSLILHRVAELIGDPDPYAAAKKQGNEAALAMLPALRDKIKAADDKLETAVRLAVVGNVIDLGIKHEADLNATVEQALGDGFARFEYDAFKQKLASAKRVLYILDNAGEIVFDKLLMDGLKANGKMVLAAVKGGPILNDALIADARQVGLDKAVKVIDTGNNFVGVIRDQCSEFFLKVLDTADMVIAKGQGNYETLDDSGDRFFFILKAKCGNVADALGVKVGDLALVRG